MWATDTESLHVLHSSSASTVGSGNAPIGVKSYLSTSYTVSKLSVTDLSLDSVSFSDGAGIFTAGASVYTAPVAGRYLLMAQVGWQTTLEGERQLTILHNATEVARSKISNTDGMTALQPVQTVVQAASGDTFGFQMLNNSSATTINLLTGVNRTFAVVQKL
jgi:hypothetical protein